MKTDILFVIDHSISFVLGHNENYLNCKQEALFNKQMYEKREKQITTSTQVGPINFPLHSEANMK